MNFEIVFKKMIEIKIKKRSQKWQQVKSVHNVDFICMHLEKIGNQKGNGYFTSVQTVSANLLKKFLNQIKNGS